MSNIKWWTEESKVKRKMKLIRFHIRGLSPGMLQNPATPELLESLRTKTPMQRKKDITLLQDAEGKMYRSEPGADGTPGMMGFPMQNMMSCLVIAGRSVKSGKKGLSTAKDTQIFSFLDFVGDFCPFKNCDEKGNVPWSAFPVKGTMHTGPSETAVCINRPRIKNWETAFVVKFDEKQGIDLTTLKLLVETAGRKVGIGDWRPAKRGQFGRFVTTKIEVLDIKEEIQVIEEVEYSGPLAEKAPDDLKALL